MRVQLRHQRDDGAVAVIVAILAVVLIGITAFTTDYGLAYVGKRQLQTASDAASLAAAGTYALSAGSCAQLAASGALLATTGASADAIREANKPGSGRQVYSVRCDGNDYLIVTYASSGTSPRLFGGIFGAGDYQLGRTASASVEPASGGTGLRPYAVCNSDLPPRNSDGTYNAPPGVFKLSYTNSLCQKPAGNWWTVNCPETTTKNSSTILAAKTRNGCDDPIEIVANQPATDPALTIALKAACSGGADNDCLEADTGQNFNDSKILAAWDSLIGKSITLPVFYNNTLVGTGNNTTYPVYRLVGVRICGYHWGKNAYGPSGVTGSGPCAGANAQPGGNAENYLLVNWTFVMATGSSSPNSCGGGLGSNCDTGVRSIRLVD